MPLYSPDSSDVQYLTAIVNLLMPDFYRYNPISGMMNRSVWESLRGCQESIDSPNHIAHLVRLSGTKHSVILKGRILVYLFNVAQLHYPMLSCSGCQLLYQSFPANSPRLLPIQADRKEVQLFFILQDVSAVSIYIQKA